MTLSDVSAEGNTIIETHKLTKYYGNDRGIIDVSFRITSGEIFGFLGPNGAGKTTTIRTLLDYIRPTGGSAKVIGHDPQAEGARVRRKVGYLPSDFSMSLRMDAGEYLRFLLGMMEYTGNDRIEDLADRFKLDLSRRIKNLSRGNRQKIALVSAFMHNPELLIMDEPTSGLDPLMQQEFYKLLMEEKDRGNTIFLSSHILSEVDAVCDRVGIIREGKLITVETIDEFKRKTGRLMIVTFKSTPPPAAGFKNIKGVSDVKIEGNTMTITVFSNVDALIKKLAEHTIVDLAFENTSLEHIFLRYYGMEAVKRNEVQKAGSDGGDDA